jgi:SAM-dependent methyltransferase
MKWPPGAFVSAIDWSMQMIRRRGLADGGAAGTIVAADWRQMPFGDSRMDVVIGDGVYASLNSFEDCVAVNGEVWRVLRPGGWFVQRCFLRPEQPESVDPLFRDLLECRIDSIDVFRWRLAMALHPRSGASLRAGDVWDEWSRRMPDTQPLLERRGWTIADLVPIERWRGEDTQVPMPSQAEFRAMTSPRFELLEHLVPAYPMGDCFPTMVLRAHR